MTRIVIIGAGGHGRELLDVIEAANAERPDAYEFIGFLDDATIDSTALDRRNAPRLGRTETYPLLVATFVLGIGDPSTRARLDAQLLTHGDAAPPLIHPLSSSASDNRFESGVVLCAGARVTTNVHLGRHTHLNVNSVVSHDCRIGPYVTVSPGAMLNGNVEVGERVFFGTGAIVLPGVSVGDDAVVAAGAVVTTDVAAGSTVVGAPARSK